MRCIVALANALCRIQYIFGIYSSVTASNLSREIKAIPNSNKDVARAVVYSSEISPDNRFVNYGAR